MNKVGFGSTVLAAAACAATPAIASPSTLTATGKVTSITALQNGSTVTTPSGSIKVGDIYTISATFDLAKAELTSLYDVDPTINIYYLPGTVITYTIGSFSRTFSPSIDFNSSVQLWNNYLSGGTPVDNQSFSFFDYNVMPTSNLPFDLGTGQQSASVNLFAFDFSATTRTNDLISQIAPFSAFSSKSFSLGRLNSDTNLFVDVEGSVTTESLDAVPEPVTWSMMILGFAMAGLNLRHRGRQSARVACV